ncbi:hypothetical protein [Phytohabitans houttuyneae]|uniref:Uncharacterized protein n=1 Tax=Phytohabitans houttuyneae TaxID=1076126 RepID=A0A6V8KHL7_9ACTN|nr:hypothetical protein [Phytohabitans houttuyneae]GFJ81599.1 hypothetical protein Phou_057790 [Phytohabitans houttuyneae]
MVAGPGRSRAVTGAAVPDRLHPLVLGDAGIVGIGASQPEVPLFRRLAAGHAERRCELGPAKAAGAGDLDQLRLPLVQQVAQLTEHGQGLQDPVILRVRHRYSSVIATMTGACHRYDDMIEDV